MTEDHIGRAVPGWQGMDSAPKDGTPCRVRRVYDGRVVKDGIAYFGVLGAEAPARRSMGLDPLSRLSSDDYVREAADRMAWVAARRWLNEDGLHAFPTPTEWLPDPPEVTG